MKPLWGPPRATVRELSPAYEILKHPIPILSVRHLTSRCHHYMRTADFWSKQIRTFSQRYTVPFIGHFGRDRWKMSVRSVIGTCLGHHTAGRSRSCHGVIGPKITLQMHSIGDGSSSTRISGMNGWPGLGGSRFLSAGLMVSFWVWGRGGKIFLGSRSHILSGSSAPVGGC